MARRKRAVIDDDGYYDPQLGEFVAAAPAAIGAGVRTVRRGYSRALETARKIPFFRKYEVWIKLLGVLVVWVVGWLVIREILKSKLVKAFSNAVTGAVPPFANWGEMFIALGPAGAIAWSIDSFILGGIMGMGPPDLTQQQKDEIAKLPADQQAQINKIYGNSYQEFNIWVIAWTLICVVIALYVYGSTQRETQ